MSKLKNLTLENILNESQTFQVPKGDSYIKTYPEFIEYFKKIDSITQHDLVISSHFVYGWMPTIIDLNFEDIENALFYLNQAKNGELLNTQQLKTLKKTINNSIVGTSKLLHFINPEIYAIWDSRIFRYTTEKKSSYGLNNPEIYLEYLNKIEEIKKSAGFIEIQTKMNNLFSYPVTANRIIEILMFEADKKEHQRLIG